MPTIEEIVLSIQRFRILCVGRSGAGKTSLISHVFRVKELEDKISHFRPGKADINVEFVYKENDYFVLHDSEGFETGSNTTFKAVRSFVCQRSKEQDIKDRVHAIWLCVKTPAAGGRIFETGDENLLKLAHEHGIPVVVIFTQYDRLVRTKKEDLKGKIDMEDLERRSREEAEKVLLGRVGLLNKSTNMPRSLAPLDSVRKELNEDQLGYICVSVRKGYQDGISTLVGGTRDLVQHWIQGEAWVMWAIAQRASLPEKIDACIDHGVSYYHMSLSAGCTLGVGNMLLAKCLAQVHRDIITCWNFKDSDKILIGDEFQQLLLYLVQDIQDRSRATGPSDIDKIAHFVALVTAASAPIAPPVAVLGLTYFFIRWMSNTVLDAKPDVERMIMAYTVDLILVLTELFDFTLKPQLAGTTNWEVLKEAFEAYERSSSRKHVHDACRAAFERSIAVLDRDGFRKILRDLLGKGGSVGTGGDTQ